ncbi:restriction endonuclease-like protein [Cytobacillus firmus]|uniref:restriction endonuclease-like protein n=1 Tax=Cytobacillus firmus TaxID=1399 RepID=UPI002161318A|nr:restriction endonuclease-like protein [Cytobacillus firmus]MCS0653427.1 restriction endonuclease-like protein [Cytobacillus firmus]
MALHPSGSRNEVELVKIETDDFSVVVKGKPFHERYEGLKQYRAMDMHDVMQFSVHGDQVNQVLIYDIETQLLQVSTQLRPIFFENGVYQVIVIPKTSRDLSFYHEHPGLRQSISKVEIPNTYMLMGNLQFQNEVGLTTFEIRDGSKKLLEVTLEIFPAKLDYKNDYKKLLEEVNDEIYNLAFHFIRKTYLGARVKLDGKPSRSEFYRLISKHFDQFLQAINRIERQPHHLLQKTYEKVRGDQLNKLDTRSRSYLQKRPHLYTEVSNGIHINNKTLMPTEGLRIKKELTFDTLENRYVKWMMQRVTDKLYDLLKTLRNRNTRWEVEPDADLLDKIIEMIKQLEGKLKSPFWKGIKKLDRSILSLVLQMAPGYRDAFQIYLTVSKGLMLQGKLYQMSVKDVATLYEYWTFLKLGQILDKKYQLVSQDIIQVNREGMFVNLQTGRSATRKYKHPYTKEEIILTYQKYESDLPTIPQKPDTMLSIAKKGKDYTYNYVFDAKYRIDYAQEGSYYQNRYKQPGPLEDDINTMHRYRDSIVAYNDGPYERTAFGAYVLFPWFNEELYQDHHFYKSIDKVNIGGLPFLPNATVLVERFVERLIEKSPEEIQQEGILPRGTLEEWNSSLDEKVLVGLVRDREEYISCKQTGRYGILVEKLKAGWQETKHVALYVKNGVLEHNGVICYGRVKDIKPLISGIDEYMQFEVEHWINCNPIIKPVGYGIADYMQTTLSNLKDSTELPELFMKSKEEKVLWRMLRRVSDRISIELDSVNLDNATKVEEYRIKGILIKLNKENREAYFIVEGEQKTIPFDSLQRNPSAIFKDLIEILDRVH